ncbi:MAG: DUF2177 family protein [Polaromonas sp.]|uniref:DUF2177 family protein n=1 Tax=Polaromonas sp. TaxID=1869339 RepID=UPI00272F38A0|nr:DUF2177 family protein [Polaromonas sp.]MDP1742632.1 DUF2177 family protein [Polaromonas sp.]MDP1955600.1 DUF2177 family protein [Polaromonas sp.]MDP3752508.1 DUF2177 family protein [Polaromonas sp.]
MKNTVLAYAAALLLLIVADGLWLGLVMPQQYQAWIGPLMRAQPLWLAAGAFYLLYPAGVVVFAVLPALARQSWQRSAGLGGLLGLIAYGTYDLSNLATLEGWPWQLTLVDMAWGAALTAAAAVAGFFAVRAWGQRKA